MLAIPIEVLVEVQSALGPPGGQLRLQEVLDLFAESLLLFRKPKFHVGRSSFRGCKTCRHSSLPHGTVWMKGRR